MFPFLSSLDFSEADNFEGKEPVLIFLFQCPVSEPYIRMDRMTTLYSSSFVTSLMSLAVNML